MTRRAKRQAKPAESLRWPLFLAISTLIGLATGLLGTGMADWICWITLGSLVAMLIVLSLNPRVR